MNRASSDTEEKIVIRRTFSVPREALFCAWTEPEQLKRWFSPKAEIEVALAEVDLCVGGRYRIGMRDPQRDVVMFVGGIYEEILPNRKLVFTWAWEHEAQASQEITLVSLEFRGVQDGTELVLTHDRFLDRQSQDGHNASWGDCLDRLERLASEIGQC